MPTHVSSPFFSLSCMSATAMLGYIKTKTLVEGRKAAIAWLSRYITKFRPRWPFTLRFNYAPHVRRLSSHPRCRFELCNNCMVRSSQGEMKIAMELMLCINNCLYGISYSVGGFIAADGLMQMLWVNGGRHVDVTVWFDVSGFDYQFGQNLFYYPVNVSTAQEAPITCS